MFRCKTAEMNTVSTASASCAEAGSVRSCTENTVLAVVLGAMLVASIFVSLALRLFLQPLMIVMIIIMIMICKGTSGFETRTRY